MQNNPQVVPSKNWWGTDIRLSEAGRRSERPRGASHVAGFRAVFVQAGVWTHGVWAAAWFWCRRM